MRGKLRGNRSKKTEYKLSNLRPYLKKRESLIAGMTKLGLGNTRLFSRNKGVLLERVDYSLEFVLLGLNAGLLKSKGFYTGIRFQDYERYYFASELYVEFLVSVSVLVFQNKH